MTINQQLIEATARTYTAEIAKQDDTFVLPPWDELDSGLQAETRQYIQRVLEAAMPHIREQIAEEIRKAKSEARAEALTKARAHLDRIAPNGLISKADVLGDLALWAERATRGIQPNGNPYTEES